MAAVAGGVLAAEVHQAGGVGFIGGGHTPLENLKQEVQKARETLSLPPDADLPIGIGLILWRLEEPHLSTSLAQYEPDTWLRYILHEARASAVWLSFTNGSLGEWVKRVRRVEKEGERRERVRVVAMVQTEKAARELLATEGVDAIVAQGTESGGHGPTDSVGSPLHTLLTTLSPLFLRSSPPFLLAAGGLASPSTIRSALAISPVAGIVPGTALSVSRSSLLPLAQKELLVCTPSGAETTRGLKWDEARGTNGWPGWCDGRGVRNLTSDDAEEEKGLTSEERVERYKRAVREGDVRRVVTWAGAFARSVFLEFGF
ncbi:hypothetical protein NBRC10512_002941 [Rhodotorula toruloides]|uniref:2-nitropropane dioxygenase n=1 Tax=Rhodotorula toruloides (strain NP11) TaxID=1130832 RepID=M7WN50_RHOT1|nr:2-nitropropane dioxygenase [Rhodotorula toruloides NP11]EMS19501.1 2-nitropropane dioxygenase [Rhodotorula toruloides NP11]